MTHREVIDVQIEDLIELTEGHDINIKELIMLYSDLKYRIERLEKQCLYKEESVS